MFKTKAIFQLCLSVITLFAGCKTAPKNDGRNESYKTRILYNSQTLVIEKLSDNVYQHKSFLNTNSFGRVDCNGMIVAVKNEAIVFDTPANDSASRELIRYVTDSLGCKIKGIIPTHFHEDCVGGLEEFYRNNIPSYASNKTIELLNLRGRKFSKPFIAFDGNLSLAVGDKAVYAEYLGQGHTIDNTIGYFPEDKALFGGCLVKELNAGKGNLADANVKAWPATVSNIRQRYPEARIVIPGHGKWGGTALLDYTIQLFR